ncbi:TonB-dependent receptor [Runella zeae]|uniref:TonB-dependent receptor n=1 Tax=Runella zeae TaxID=94255 RepID=UPI0004213B2E|nr:TonB-dependent receptor [Runella zeae]
MKHLLFLFGIFSTTFLAYSQDKKTISGYIKDATNGESLIGVSVYVREIGNGTVANDYGYYALSLPSGSYTLIFNYLGYEKVEKKIDLKNDLKLNIELKDESLKLQEVVVKTTKEDENVKSIEMSVNKVEMKTIRQMPALLGEVDIVRSIQLLPGVTSVGEGASGFNVRGGNIDQNLVLLDEAPVFNSSHLFGFFSVFNPDAIKDVKLIKGGIPAQYGGRTSSILDVRLKEGNAKTREINGGIGTIFSRLSYEQPFAKGKGSFIVAGRRSYIDVLAKPFLSGDLKNSRFYFYDLTAKANYRINDKNTIYASGYFGRDVFGADFGFDWGNQTATARWNHLFNDKLFLNATTFYSNYDYGLESDRNNTNTSGDKFKWNSNIQTWSIKPDFTYYLTPNNTITFGGQYINYTSRPGTALALSSGEERTITLDTRYADESALYIGNEQKINNWLSFQYGIRYSYFRNLGPGTSFEFLEVEKGERKIPISENKYETGVINTYGNWEPRFSAKIEVSPAASIKVSYNRTAQYLHLLSNTAASSPLDVWTLSSKIIKPQIADQVALGWFQNLQDNMYEASLEIYYKDLQNQIDYVRNSDLLLNRYLEGDLLFGNGRAYGTEFYIKKNRGKLTGWLSYTLARTERKIEGINRNDWFPARFDKTHNLSVVGLYQLNDRWSFSTNFAFNTGTPATFPTNRFEWGEWALPHNVNDSRNAARIPSYHRLDIGATLKSKKKLFGKGQGEWVFSVYNVYNRRNPFSTYLRQNEDNNLQTEAVRYSIIGSVVPAVTYNFKF